MIKKLLFSLLLVITFGLLKPANAFAAASLSLSPATGSYKIGDVFNVDIILNTGGDAVSGATAILTYDTTKLQVTTGSQITAGSIFTTPLTNTVSGGTIRFDSGSLGTAYTGTGTMATISFKALATGTAAVNFVFNPSTTTNTSLVAAASTPTNLLNTVNNGSYTISTTTTTTTPVTGAVEDTLMVFGGGIFLILASVLLYKFRLA